jgi:hypothetical protein
MGGVDGLAAAMMFGAPTQLLPAVAVPTKGDKPHGIGIVFEKPTNSYSSPGEGFPFR